jgi:hypothetical protein
MNYKLLIAAALILVGFIFLSSAVGLQVIRDPGEPNEPSPLQAVSEMYPGGDDGSPTVLEAGTTVNIRMVLAARDTTYASWSIVASIAPYPYTYSSTTPKVVLTFKTFTTVAGSTGRLYLADYQGAWTVPYSTEDQLFRVQWTVKYNGDLLATRTSYCRTIGGSDVPDEVPSGAFTINGQAAGTDSNIVANDGKLTFAFTPSQAADRIGKVYIEMWDDNAKISTIELKASSGVYSGSYTLPDHGYYTLKGFIQPTGSNAPVQTLSIFMDNPDDGSGTDSYYPWVGIALIVGGVTVFFISRRDAK